MDERDYKKPALKTLGRLISRVRKGEVEAFRELYELYAKKILNYAYRMTRSKEEAEDVTQETFILAYQHLASLKEPGKFQSWLFRIAQNNIYQKYRARTPHLESIDTVVEEHTQESRKAVSPDKSPEERLLSKELEARVQQAIDQLPEKYKQVFVLSAVQRLSYQDIAAIVGRSLPSVKSDIHRARVEVRNKVKEYLGENYGM